MKIQLGALVAGKGATEPEENPENKSNTPNKHEEELEHIFLK